MFVFFFLFLLLLFLFVFFIFLFHTFLSPSIVVTIGASSKCPENKTVLQKKKETKEGGRFTSGKSDSSNAVEWQT